MATIGKVVILFSTVLLCNTILVAQIITRGPYLNAVSEHSAVIRWKTDKPIKGKVTWWIDGKSSPGGVTEKRKTKVKGREVHKKKEKPHQKKTIQKCSHPLYSFAELYCCLLELGPGRV